MSPCLGFTVNVLQELRREFGQHCVTFKIFNVCLIMFRTPDIIGLKDII